VTGCSVACLEVANDKNDGELVARLIDFVDFSRNSAEF
jgi:hypothetical protein